MGVDLGKAFERETESSCPLAHSSDASTPGLELGQPNARSRELHPGLACGWQALQEAQVLQPELTEAPLARAPGGAASLCSQETPGILPSSTLTCRSEPGPAATMRRGHRHSPSPPTLQVLFRKSGGSRTFSDFRQQEATPTVPAELNSGYGRGVTVSTPRVCSLSVAGGRAGVCSPPG